MRKKYKVTKSEYYTDEKRTLFSSYIFEYFSHRINEWCILKNGDMKEYLKNTILNDLLAINDEISCDFDLVLGIGRRIK